LFSGFRIDWLVLVFFRSLATTVQIQPNQWSSALALEFPVKFSQLIDGVGSADLGIFFFAEPRKPLLEQLEHPLDKGSRWAILWGHRITSIVVVVK
jgi:hypothetical protein